MGSFKKAKLKDHLKDAENKDWGVKSNLACGEGADVD